MLFIRNMSIVVVLFFILLGCTQNTKEVEDTSIVNETVVEEIVSDSTSQDVVVVTTTQDQMEVPEVEVPEVEVEISEVRNIREQHSLVSGEEVEVILEEAIPSNWYIRLVAVDTNRNLKTNITQLGEVETSIEADKHTLLSGGRFSNPYLDIVFIDPESVPAGDYKTHYKVHEENIDTRWEFSVQTDDVNAEISLTWNGLYILSSYIDDRNRLQYNEYRSLSNPLIHHMKLFDMDTGVEVPIHINGEVQTYAFSMNGQNVHTFAWEIQYE